MGLLIWKFRYEKVLMLIYVEEILFVAVDVDDDVVVVVDYNVVAVVVVDVLIWFS